MKEHFEKLGIDPETAQDLKEIKKAYHKLAQKYHPDKEDGDAEKFREVHHAYKMLTDDSYRVMESKRANGQTNLDAIFNITVDFYQAFFGDKITITFNPVHIDDKGQPVKIDTKEDVHFDVEVISVRIPEGTTTGAQRVVAAKGLVQRGKRGNLILVFQVQPHPKFRLQGPDVLSQEEIPLDTMLTGGETEIKTMWGLKTLRIPAGTKPNEKLQIKRAGVRQAGNHIVTVIPKFPEKKDLQEGDIWKKLGINWDEETRKDDEEREKEEEYEKLFKNLGGKPKDEKDGPATFFFKF